MLVVHKSGFAVISRNADTPNRGYTGGSPSPAAPCTKCVCACNNATMTLTCAELRQQGCAVSHSKAKRPARFLHSSAIALATCRRSRTDGAIHDLVMGIHHAWDSHFDDVGMSDEKPIVANKNSCNLTPAIITCGFVCRRANVAAPHGTLQLCHNTTPAFVGSLAKWIRPRLK